MNPSTPFYVFKLRNNIILEDDLKLARMELEAFEGVIKDVPDIQGVTHDVPELEKLAGLPALSSYVRRKGQQAYRAYAPLALLPELIRCTSFVQAIYCVTHDTPEVHQFLHEVENRLGPVAQAHTSADKLIIHAVPHYALFELSDVVSRHSKNMRDTQRHLALLLDALVGG
jgi:hypothetical protein